MNVISKSNPNMGACKKGWLKVGWLMSSAALAISGLAGCGSGNAGATGPTETTTGPAATSTPFETQTPSATETEAPLDDDPCDGQTFERYGISDDLMANACIVNHWLTRDDVDVAIGDTGPVQYTIVKGEYSEFTVKSTDGSILATYRLSYSDFILRRTH